jgi:hypothetical protein
MSRARIFIEASAVPATYEVFENLLHSTLGSDLRVGSELYAQAFEDTPLYAYLQRFAIENETSLFYPHELIGSPSRHIAFVDGSMLTQFKPMHFPTLTQKPSIIIVSDERNAL